MQIDRRGSTIGLLIGGSVAAQSIAGFDQPISTREVILIAVAVGLAFWGAKLALLPIDQKKIVGRRRLATWQIGTLAKE